MILELYVIIGIAVAIIGLLTVNLSKGFDKYVHDKTEGLVEFTSSDKIIVPLIMGLTWPYGVYLAVRKVIHG